VLGHGSNHHRIVGELLRTLGIRQSGSKRHQRTTTNATIMIFIHRTVVFPGTFGLLLRRRKKKKKEIQLGHFRRVSCAEATVSKL
jgi:hypothetical protein